MSVEKTVTSPDVCAWPDDEHNNYHIEVTLPGVDKDKVFLKMHEDSYFVKGEADDTIYVGSYSTCCEIEPKKAKATYSNGLLKVDVPFKEESYESISVKIE